MKPLGFLRTKNKKQEHISVLILLFIARYLVKIIGFFLTFLVFYCSAIFSFSKIEPIDMYAMTYSVLATMIIWR